MKKIIAVIIISVSLISISAHAQTPKTAKHGSGETKQMLKDSLHLTDAQADSVISIREEFRAKIKNVMSNTTVAADKRKEEIKPLREQMKMRLKAILTKEQMQKMQEMRKGKTDDNNQ
jgi:hypothetical protein